MTGTNETAHWIREKGHLKTSDTALELWGEKLLAELGFVARRCEKGIPIRAAMIAAAGEWRPREASEVTKYPDRLVDVGNVTKVVLFDGWAVHHRTLTDDRETARENSLYLAAGYQVVRVSDFWMANAERTARLKPLLVKALRSSDPVVDLSS